MYEKKIVDGVVVILGEISAIEASEMMLEDSEKAQVDGKRVIADSLIGQHYNAALAWGVTEDCMALRDKLGLKPRLRGDK